MLSTPSMSVLPDSEKSCIRTDFTDLDLSMIVSVPTSIRPMSVALVPVFSSSRFTTVRQRLLTSSLSEQNPILVCPSPIVYLPADTPSNCSSSACARGQQLSYRGANLVDVGAGEVDVHGKDANILGPAVADSVGHRGLTVFDIVGHPASVACKWRLVAWPGRQLPGGLLPPGEELLPQFPCPARALQLYRGRTGGWEKLALAQGVRWLRKTLT